MIGMFYHVRLKLASLHRTRGTFSHVLLLVTTDQFFMPRVGVFNSVHCFSSHTSPATLLSTREAVHLLTECKKRLPRFLEPTRRPA